MKKYTLKLLFFSLYLTSVLGAEKNSSQTHDEPECITGFDEVLKGARLTPLKGVGLKITEIKKSSLFEKKGFLDEDIILKVGNRSLLVPADIENFLHSLCSTDHQTITLKRSKKTMKLDW